MSPVRGSVAKGFDLFTVRDVEPVVPGSLNHIESIVVIVISTLLIIIIVYVDFGRVGACARDELTRPLREGLGGNPSLSILSVII